MTLGESAYDLLKAELGIIVGLAERDVKAKTLSALLASVGIFKRILLAVFLFTLSSLIFGMAIFKLFENSLARVGQANPTAWLQPQSVGYILLSLVMLIVAALALRERSLIRQLKLKRLVESLRVDQAPARKPDSDIDQYFRKLEDRMDKKLEAHLDRIENVIKKQTEPNLLSENNVERPRILKQS